MRHQLSIEHLAWRLIQIKDPGPRGPGINYSHAGHAHGLIVADDAIGSTPAVIRREHFVRALYAVERQAQEATATERLALRQKESAPLLAELRLRLLAWKEQLLPRHPIAEAMAYALAQWKEFTVFCTDGAIPMDNNVSERERKRVVLTRKNSLFVENERGGRTAAILASFTSTCRRHAIDPQLYLSQLLVNLPGLPARQLSAWRPDQWKQRQRAPFTNSDYLRLA